ncbi:DEK domain-containing chromatin-associated protein 1 isoform X3 [Lathyrus oleraceus]|uniref:DEK domain-containing chromatin-associated protein 1 isoform X3 n=1 Tax=Pisum sativum TaxID=3888 RepID=UPI0021D17D8B|nr:DEK domain-containing chromatin-associated protein 1-like isoform X3 [Pisum sativum]
MATETLIDNQPSLHDKLHDLPPNENKAAADEEVDALTEVDESKEKKEIDDQDDESEKDEEKDEGDEGTDEDEEDEEAKGSQLRKEAESEKKSPITPTSDRPTRERKVVERYSEPSSIKVGKSASSKTLVIEKGRGTQLKDIPNVAFKLSKRKPDETLHLLHNLLFGKRTKVHNLKRNIGQFSGYVWAENEVLISLEKQRIKAKERIDKFVREKLSDFCDVLNIPINKGSTRKEDLSAKLLEFLESPHATTDVLLAEKKQKAKAKKKRTRKTTPGKSPKGASTETLAKKKKQTPQSGKKRKLSSDAEDDDTAEISDAKDESQEDEDEDVAVANNGTDDEVGKSEEEEEEDISEAHKSKSKQSGRETSVAKAESKNQSVKKTSAKAAQSSEESPDKLIPKKSITDHDSVSIPKSNQPDTKKLKTGKEKQDTKKDAIKTSKAVKGKSRKKKVEEPSREAMHSVVANILKEVDFNTATLSDILRQLGTHFGLDLMHRKSEVKNIITDVINSMSDEEGDDEEAENDGDGDVEEGGDASDEGDNE